MKSNKHLTSLPEFWLALLIPLGIATIISITIIKYSELTLDLSYLGFNNLLNIFKVPLAVAALSFPLVALVATNHRSRQSAKQIQLSTEQNSFANYYKHKEEFEKVLSKLENLYSISFVDTTKLYKSIFPKNSISILHTSSIHANSKSNLEEFMNNYLSICKRTQVYADNQEEFKKVYFDLFLLSDVYLKFKIINEEERTKLPFGNKNQKNYVIAFTNSDVLRHGTIIQKVLIELFNFSEIENKLPSSYPAESSKFKDKAKETFFTENHFF